MSAGTGKVSELHPRTVARDLGLEVPSGPLEWRDLLDAAITAYWNNRVPMKAICGTRSGFRHHQASGTRPCMACRKADSAERQQRRARAAGGGVGKGKPGIPPAHAVDKPGEKDVSSVDKAASDVWASPEPPENGGFQPPALHSPSVVHCQADSDNEGEAA